LRRAMGFKRSELRMKAIEEKLRAGMSRNGIAGETQDAIVQSIVSFALYGFPESHAASFALLAYASAYLKCHYLAAFTAALLNNQPMGFYSPAVLVKDAQRHGLRVKPIDVTCSDWNCTLEKDRESFAMRLGLRYVKGLSNAVGSEIARQRAHRAFASIDDLKLRVPAIQKSEFTALAEVGALNFIAGHTAFHRRDALWQVERAARRAGPLLETLEETRGLEKESDSIVSPSISPATPSSLFPSASASPLSPMTADERLIADYRGTGLTVGPHPMAYRRAQIKAQGIRAACELRDLPDGARVRIAGAVIARQRPGTAKGFVFLSLEDETGIANAILTPQIFRGNRLVVVEQQFLVIEGQLQNQEGAISVKAEKVWPLSIARIDAQSHDFH
jgi:error-prone DNA polymerase